MERTIQITAGRGPAECCWVVAQVLKVMMDEARNGSIECSVIQREKGPENGTLFSASVLLKGQNVDSFLQKWTGTIQWVGESKFRKHHRRKNWFVAVNKLQLSTDYELNENDIAYKAVRSGGPGGQHVNKVSTAVRATHIPTGLSVLASDSRSQLQNRKMAKERLTKLLMERDLKAKGLAIKANWQNHNELNRGNPVRTFRGSDFKPRHKEKKYKKERNRLKNEFRKMDPDD